MTGQIQEGSKLPARALGSMWRGVDEYIMSAKPKVEDYGRNRRLLSRKWLLALATLGGMLYCGIGDIGLSTAECVGIVVPAVAYIFGEAYVDGQRPRPNEVAGPTQPTPATVPALAEPSSPEPSSG